MDDEIKKYFKTNVTIDFQECGRAINPEIYEEVRELWALAELGNDTDYYRYDVEEEEKDWGKSVELPNLHQFIKDSGYPVVMLHWWW
jgi:hypothetical protein